MRWWTSRWTCSGEAVSHGISRICGFGPLTKRVGVTDAILIEIWEGFGEEMELFVWLCSRQPLLRTTDDSYCVVRLISG
jgi:hypothetical protein